MIAVPYLALCIVWKGTPALEEPGPRFMIPVLPFLAVPLAVRLGTSPTGRARCDGRERGRRGRRRDDEPPHRESGAGAVRPWSIESSHREFLPTIWSIAFGRLGYVVYIATVALVVVAIARLVTRESARGIAAPNRANRCSLGASRTATLGAMSDTIVVRGAREHNLRNVDLVLPRDQLIVFTGLSGSGKSSLAFDTIYAEGQRRYVESLSAYARQFLGQMDKPDVDFIEGLSPAISIDQKSASRNPRSTVGTITEIYDYLRLLYARIGVPHCPNCGQLITRQTPQQIVDRVLQLPDGTRFQVLAPVVRGRKGEYHALLDELAGQGFTRARVDGEVVDLPGQARSSSATSSTRSRSSSTGLVRRAGIERRLTDSLETALKLAEGVAEVEIVPKDDKAEPPETLVFSEHLACMDCGLSFEELAPRNFSFNSPYGACETLRRHRHEVPSRSRAHRSRRRPLDRRRRDRTVVRVPRRVLQAGARSRSAKRTASPRRRRGRSSRPRRRRSCSTDRARRR